MGCVSFTTKAKDTNTAAMQMAMIIWPGTVSTRVWYQSVLINRTSGILISTRIAMVTNSLRGPKTRFSSSPLTTLISDSLLTMGVRVLFRLRSVWHAITASHHSCHTSLSMAYFRS